MLFDLFGFRFSFTCTKISTPETRLVEKSNRLFSALEDMEKQTVQEAKSRDTLNLTLVNTKTVPLEATTLVSKTNPTKRLKKELKEGMKALKKVKSVKKSTKTT